ncbi:MAG: hypothetical protein M1839_009203 [Geoglossum umbratile]|nr:MAG: hypothetical protein M1839_009203 [Geoglossum umbratile]
MKWDGVADQQLLLSILATHTIVLNHNAIAQRIGPHCSARAVVERIKKLRKISRDNGFDKDGEGYVPKPPKATASNRKRKNITPDDTPSPKKAKADEKKVVDDSEESHEDIDVTGTHATRPGPSEFSAAYECEDRENTEQMGDGAYGAENTHQEGFVKKEPSSLVPELAIDGFAYEPLNLYGHHDDLLIPFTNED